MFGCLVGRFTKGLRVDLRVPEWMVGWMGCLVGRFTNGLRVVEGLFVWT